MSHRIEKLINNNRKWASAFEKENPGVFDKLAKQQNPDYLWIGCSDSRVPANNIVGLLPGEVFVHRNIANLMNYGDLNLLSVLEYAVGVLKVSKIIVCGHYGCGGVRAALEKTEHGIVDHWLTNIKDTYNNNLELFIDSLSEKEKVDLLCELNVKRQVRNVCHTPVVQNAWKQGSPLSVHGVIYGIEDGLLKDLQVAIDSTSQLDEIYHL